MYKYSNPLRKGCVGERIGTSYLRPGGTCPLKGASLVVGLYKFTISPKGNAKDAPCVLSILKTPCYSSFKQQLINQLIFDFFLNFKIVHIFAINLQPRCCLCDCASLNICLK